MTDYRKALGVLRGGGVQRAAGRPKDILALGELEAILRASTAR